MHPLVLPGAVLERGEALGICVKRSATTFMRGLG